MNGMRYVMAVLCAGMTLCAAAKPQTYRLPEKMPEPVESMGREIYDAVQKQAAYLIGKTKPWKENASMKLLTKSGHTEHFIRPNTGTVLGLAFLYRFGPYDAQTVGVSREALLSDTLLPMMRYLILTHRSQPTDSGKSWYKQWQSAHWAYSLGKAGWWLWDELPPELQEGLKQVIRDEAERFYTVEPPHRLRKDTASEENAWNSQIFHIASLLMPDDPDCERWQALYKKWVLSSYITPGDLKSGNVVDGIALSAFRGANIYDDFTLENHNIVHPDYMAAFILSTQMAVDYRMTGREIPEFLFFNIRPIYANLKWFSLPDGGFIYPSWQDWRLFRNPDWLLNHVNMAVFCHDPDALHWARICLETIRKMQSRHPQGNIYGEKEYFFASAQNDLIIYLALAWQTLFFADGVPDAWKPEYGVRRFEEGKIIVNRQAEWMHTFSYGNKIMFMPVMNRQDRVFDSYSGSGIGNIWIEGESKALNVQLEAFSVETATDYSVTVNMKIRHGDSVKATYRITSTPQGLAVNEILTALRPVTIRRRETGVFGILNNPEWVYETGSRTLAFDDAQAITAPAGKGTVFDGVQQELVIDGRVRFRLEKPGRLRYAGAVKPQNARMTDRLTLNFSDETRTYQAGDEIAIVSYEVTAVKAETPAAPTP